MTLYSTIISPFVEDENMRRALAACIALAVSGAPLGVFLVIRRMTLIGDAASHGILSGVAIAFCISGMSLWSLTFGGLLAGLFMAFTAGAITRLTDIKEDSSFTAAYISSMAFGLMVITTHGGSEEILHMLFGNVLAIDGDMLVLVNIIASFSLLVFAAIYRPLIIECFDPSFMKVQRGKGAIYHQIFLVLVVLNLVSAFRSLGTIMAVGMMILPAIAARFWTKNIDRLVVLSVLFGIFSALIGLLISHNQSLPPEPAIVLTASFIYVFSVFFGTKGSIFARFFPRKHFHEEECG
jgi:zinc/manganese transport system permease protein